MSNHYDSNDFPEFNLSQLKRYAKKWAKKYSIIQIERIILYRYYSEAAEIFGIKIEQSFGIKTESTKYALVFEISGCDRAKLIDIALDSLPMNGDDKLTTGLKEIEFCNEIVPHPLFDPSFANTVYINQPSINYQRNWTCLLKRPEDELPKEMVVDDPCCIIFQRKLPHIPTKKKRHSQKAKEKCRKVADALWKEDATITIADMINRSEMLPYTKKPNGNFYTEKTIRDWIKHLCPDRSPGRRKGT